MSKWLQSAEAALRDFVKRFASRNPTIARVFEERDRYRGECERLAERVELLSDVVAEHNEARSAAPPQRYTINAGKYADRGGRVDIQKDVEKFVFNSPNNASDLARFYAFCLMFDEIEKDKIVGDIAEIGVYRGHTATLLADFARRIGVNLYLLDTFEGFAASDLTGVDAQQQVQFSDTSLDSVRNFVGEANVSFIKGYFPETASDLPTHGVYSIVHIDCDLYSPILAALEYFYPRLTEGGFLVIHDYSSLWWPGAEQAVDEFFADKPEWIVPMPDISGSVIVRKARSAGL